MHVIMVFETINFLIDCICLAERSITEAFSMAIIYHYFIALAFEENDLNERTVQHSGFCSNVRRRKSDDL
jgi:hypothetical protein